MVLPIRLLHISAHLGGGVGRVLSRVASLRHEMQLPVKEQFLCIEPPKDKKYIDALRKAGAEVFVAPDIHGARELISAADVVQIEWWHHPLMPEFLYAMGPFDARLVIWSHISGLSYPFIPEKLINSPDLFLFSTPVSLSRFTSNGPMPENNNLAVVNSSGGFDDFAMIHHSTPSLPLSCGYIGTYAFAKLHPHIIRYLETAAHVDYKMAFYGDPSASEDLVKQVSASCFCKNNVRVNGYTEDPASVLKNLDIFVYILNPFHYGTTENALLEAMACGVVPVVLNNPIESSIVKHRKTGFVINGPDEFALAMDFCASHPEKLLEMSRASAQDVRERFTLEKTENALGKHYARLMALPNKRHDFRILFGNTPDEWFSFALGEYADCFQGKSQDALQCRRKRLSCPIFYEKTKSSVKHFHHYYPHSEQIEKWVDLINDDIAYNEFHSKG